MTGSLPAGISAALDQRLMARHKMLFTRVVMPTIALTAIVLVISYWRFDAKFYAGLAIMLSLNFLNAYYSIADRRIGTPWGVVHSRSDEFDTFRWCANLSLDVYLLWCFEVPAAVAAFTWLILSFGALTEVYRQRNKLITIGFAVTGFIVLMFFVFPTDPTQQLYLTFAYVGLLYVLWKLESYIVEEMTLFFDQKISRERIESEADQLARQAVVGQSVRAFSHEIGNLLAIGNLTLERLRVTPNDSAQELARLEKTFGYLAKVSRLVLDDVGNERAPIRRYTLPELAEDLRLLVCGTDWQQTTRIELDFADVDETQVFSERAGAVYLIIHNLAKNAYDAVVQHHANPMDGLIRISAEISRQQIRIMVADNGGGMTAAQLECFERDELRSDKAEGHGFGLRFVRREVAENGFMLEVEAMPGAGTVFQLGLPIA